MRLSSKDFIALSIGTAIIAGLSVLFYFDLTKRIASGANEVIGEIIVKRNIAQRKYADVVVWENIESRYPVHNLDSIRTSDISEVLLRLKDGTEISLNENSMITLILNKDELDVEFLGGAISAKRKETDGKKRVNLLSGDSKLTIDNSDVNLSKQKGEDMRVTVLRGKAKIKSGDKEAEVNQDQNVNVNDGTIKVTDIPIKLNLPVSGAFMPLTDTNEIFVEFSWTSSKPDREFILEVSKNYSFSDIHKKVKTARSSAGMNCKEGILFWRVLAANKNNKDTEYSEIRKLTVINNRPPLLISPENGSLISYYKSPPAINFLWTKSDNFSSYRLIISKSPDMSNPLVNTPVGETNYAVNSLENGKYHWAVYSTIDTDKKPLELRSAVREFSIKQNADIAIPKLIYPPDKKNLPRAALSQNGINFTWEKDPSVSNVLLMVSRDTGFADTMLKTKVPHNHFNIKQDMPDGKYYWRLAVADDQGKDLFSETRSFTVSNTGIITLTKPIQGDAIVHETGTAVSPAELSWKPTQIEDSYEVAICGDEKCLKVIDTYMTTETRIKTKPLKDGRYFWKVSQKDSNSIDLMKSSVQSFAILPDLDKPIHIYPAKGSAVRIVNQKILKFKWKPVPGADRYRLALFNNNAGLYKNVFTFETAVTSYDYTVLKKLDEGEFIWTLQAIDAEGARIIRKSEESRIPFAITLGLKEKKIIIQSPKTLYLE